jgi:peroxiredoxin
MISKILFAVILLAAAILTPLNFNLILETIVLNLGLGWVFTTILIRLIVIILVSISLRLLTRAFQNTAKIKTWILVAIAFPVGFGISFISPIYTVDYGQFNDGMQLENLDILQQELNATLLIEDGHSLVAFFTSSCPHCMVASRRLGQNIEAGQKITVNAIFPGTEEDTQTFIENNNASAFNVYRIQNDSLFIALSGGTFPSLFLLDQSGKTTHHWVGDELNYTALDYLKSLEH